jgi:hypothetical protein
MIRYKLTRIIAVTFACFAASTLNAATIPAGTTLKVSTVSLISSQTVPGRSFEAKIAQDVSVKGNVVLKAGTKVFERSRLLVRILANRGRSLWNSPRLI